MPKVCEKANQHPAWLAGGRGAFGGEPRGAPWHSRLAQALAQWDKLSQKKAVNAARRIAKAVMALSCKAETAPPRGNELRNERTRFG